MKKIPLLLTITALLCSCSSAAGTSAGTGPTTETAAPPPVSQTTEAPANEELPETAPAAETTASPADGETAEADPDERFLLEGNGSALQFYKRDVISEKEHLSGFDFCYVFPTEIHDSTALHPERFDAENYLYTPAEEPKAPAYFSVRAGDEIGGHRVLSAQTLLETYGENSAVAVNEIELDGEYTFTGVLQFHYDEDYGVDAGDLDFCASEPIDGLFLPYGFFPRLSVLQDRSAFYNELGFLRVGNYFTGNASAKDADGSPLPMNDAVKAVLDSRFSGKTETAELPVTITLDHLHLYWNNQIDSRYSTGARIVDIAFAE